jgi:membrane fusion protein, multidrug efflux system
MTYETESRQRKSVFEPPRRRSTHCISSDQVGGDAVKKPAPLPRNDGDGRAVVQALAPEREDQNVDDADDERRDKPRKSMLRRHPLAFVGGLMLLVVALVAGYFYWDYAAHFESTDDAFIAARQFTIAPKVPGYVTAVPVTDNEHVVTGDVIARIDQRDYRNALAEAEAQVGAARASIETIDAQIGEL